MKKRFRVKKNTEFQEIISKGKNIVSRSFILYRYPQKMTTNDRIGISASKKLGDAVERNRIKRQVRSMCDSIFTFRTGFDVIIIVRKGYLNRNYAENYEELRKMNEKLSSLPQ